MFDCDVQAVDHDEIIRDGVVPDAELQLDRAEPSLTDRGVRPEQS